MKKKFLFLSALVAASTAFVGCSSDEDLAQVPEIVEEETPVFQGYPMYVSASAGEDTRGTDLDGDSFDAFTMYSNMAKGTTPWSTGVAFEKSTSWSAGSADVSFPDNTNSYYFYGVSDAANITKTDGKPDISTVGASFNFTYQIPTAYAAQKDLLVGKTTGSGSDGKVNFTDDNKFTHALALVSKVYIRANTAKIEVQTDGEISAEALEESYEYKVGGSMSICGANTKGTYTFGGDPAWSDQAALGEFNIPITTTAFFPFSNDWHEIPFSEGDDGLYLLPQSFSGNLTDNNDGTYTLTGAYVKVGLQIFAKGDTYNGTTDKTGEYYIHQWYPSGMSTGANSDSDEHSADAGFRPFCVPLKFTILPNKTYAIYIDLVRGCLFGADETYYPLFDNMNVILS